MIDREDALKDKLKTVRLRLKQALVESDPYKAFLAKALEDTAACRVSEKMARSIALKAARAHFASVEPDEENAQ